ncbi:DUF7507 domain-containing protein [Plantibacter sp. CFBP 8804]|uniref:DUF7507 domain-containing protein n=1 Tax=Plantibacter sp. CFBP 8804 TaxID=2775270 RepID=UPI00177FA4C4|nr:leucine-rich repeat domain-containing protein [Plantibacter sp. CFBP 8804]MBD8519133.1 leucine-rich repeat domain-containing protein [Plantibacter sp. CFBP 8804]
MRAYTRTLTALAAAATLFLSLSPVSGANALSSPDTTFSDLALRGCVAQALGIDAREPISSEQAASLRELNCNGHRIASLEGIEALSGLSKLSFTGAPLTAGLAPLSGLPELASVSVTDAQPLDLTSLASLPMLTSLSVNRSEVLDLTALSGMTQLTEVRLNSVKNNHIEPLAGLLNLTTLQLNNNGISDLAPLQDLRELQFFEATANQISDLSPMSGWTKLQHVNLRTNQITDVTPLRALTQLRTINLESNTISDVTSWSSLTGVTYLSLDHNNIVDLDSFVPMVGLETLTLSNNRVEDVAPLRDLIFIDHLDLSRNQIVSIEPIRNLSAPNYVLLNGQRLTLPVILTGHTQHNPVQFLDGSPLPVSSSSARYDESTASWTFDTAGQNTLTWTSPDLGIGSYSVFSGTITQESVTESASLTLTKTGALTNPTAGPTAGQQAHYAFELTNTGNTTLTQATIDDPMPNLSTISYSWPGTPGQLLPGESATATATYTLQQSDVDSGSLTNVATAAATTEGGTPVASDPATATITLDEEATLTLTKTADSSKISDLARPGDLISYTLGVENTGNVTVSNVAIVDPMEGLSVVSVSWPGPAGELRPGESASGQAVYAITQADIDAGAVDNSAWATGESLAGTPAQSNTASVHTPLPTQASLSLVKTADDAALQTPTQPGDTIRYQIEGSNTGTVTLHDIIVADELEGLTPLSFDWPGTPGELAPGESVFVSTSYNIQPSDLGSLIVVNTAIGTATSASGTLLEERATVTTTLHQPDAVPPVHPDDPAAVTPPGSPASADPTESSASPATGLLALTGSTPIIPLTIATGVLLLGFLLRARRSRSATSPE